MNIDKVGDFLSLGSRVFQNVAPVNLTDLVFKTNRG